MSIVLKNKNFGVSKLFSGITDVATQLTVLAGEGSKFPTSGQFRAVIWSQSYESPIQDGTREIITMQLSAGDIFTITRAQESTSAKAWNANDSVAHVITAGKIEELETEINAKVSASDLTAHTGVTAKAGHTGGLGDHNHQTTGAEGGKLDHGLALDGLGDDDHPQYIRHALATAVNDFLVASGVGAFVKKTLAETKTILGLLALAFKNTVGTADIDAASVTYAKVQNVSATNKVLGRQSAGAGVIEEIPLPLAVAKGGTGVAAIPAFSVHKNNVNQSIPAATWTKVTWATALFDTNSNFDLANERFLPTVPGKYAFSAICFLAGIVAGKILTFGLYKNGALYAYGVYLTSPAAADIILNAAWAAVEANGTTDYFELWIYQGDTVARDLSGAPTATIFSGAWIVP